MSSQRELAAIHESGHAVAVMELSALNGPVEIGAHGSGLTHVSNNLGWKMFVGELRGRDDFLLAAISGPLAESWACRDSVEEILQQQTSRNGDRGLDGDRVRALLSGDSLSRLIRRTERLLNGYSRRMDRLADALLDTGWVDGDTARGILSGRR
jgi:hypothetical protein